MSAYVLIDQTTAVEVLAGQWQTLYRIRYADGKYGGFVEGPHNLEPRGRAKILDNAKVYGNALVCENAVVAGNAEVAGTFGTGDRAIISGDAVVTDFAHVCGGAKVYGRARVFGNAFIYAYMRLGGEAAEGGELTAGPYSNYRTSYRGDTGTGQMPDPITASQPAAAPPVVKCTVRRKHPAHEWRNISPSDYGSVYLCPGSEGWHWFIASSSVWILIAGFAGVFQLGDANQSAGNKAAAALFGMLGIALFICAAIVSRGWTRVQTLAMLPKLTVWTVAVLGAAFWLCGFILLPILWAMYRAFASEFR